MTTRQANESDLDTWTEMRHSLWPNADIVELRSDSEAMLTTLGQVCFLLENQQKETVGFVEAAIYTPPEGPYCHVEGWYVKPELRGLGYGKELIKCIEPWALHHSIPLLTSDTEALYPLSPAAHAGAGYRVLHELTIFVKELQPDRAEYSGSVRDETESTD